MAYWLDEVSQIDKQYLDLERYIEVCEAQGLPHHDLSYDWWREYEARGTLPFAGGYAEQPNTWHDDVSYFRAIEALHSLPHREAYANKQINRIRDEE